MSMQTGSFKESPTFAISLTRKDMTQKQPKFSGPKMFDALPQKHSKNLIWPFDRAKVILQHLKLDLNKDFRYNSTETGLYYGQPETRTTDVKLIAGSFQKAKGLRTEICPAENKTLHMNFHLHIAPFSF